MDNLSKRDFLRRWFALTAVVLGPGCGGGSNADKARAPDVVLAPIPPQPPPVQYGTLTIENLRDVRPFCEIAPNQYLVTDDLHGSYSKRLAVYTGDIVAGNGDYRTIPSFHLNDTTERQGLYAHDGVTIVSGRLTAIQQVWKLRSGTFLMMTRADDEIRYLHRISASPDFHVGTAGNNRWRLLALGSEDQELFS